MIIKILKNNKGLELSVNFLVIVIIGIVLFGFGIMFMNQIFFGAKDIKDITSEDLDKRIGQLMCEGSERVCFGFNKKEVPRNELGIFGVKITNMLNIGNNADFYVTVEKGIALNDEGNEINNEGLDCKPDCGTPRSMKIDRLESEEIALGILVNKNAQPGTYTFDVTICHSSEACARGDSYFYDFNQIHIEVP